MLQPLVDALREAVLRPGARELIALMSEPVPPASSPIWLRLFIPLVRTVLVNTPEPFWATGMANGSATTSLARAGFELGVTEIGCMAHTRRKFCDLHATNKSQIAKKALHHIAA